MARIAVAMSGGVDSATAAALLVEAGHEVVGMTLQLWDYTGVNLQAGRGRCCSPADIADARATAAELGIPHYIFDHGAEFRRQIVEPFLDEYVAGSTPSPCIRCNRHIKFGSLWRLARSLGATELATGHYARLAHDDGRPKLRKAVDADKDQSYFLFDVPAAGLRDVRFPLGDLAKDEVRRHARRLSVPVADKPDSYELCFIPDGDKNAFIDRERPAATRRAVSVTDADGVTLSTVRGLHRLTVGQRKGIGISGPGRRYVIGVDAEAGRVVVGDEAALLSTRLTATRCNWLAIDPPQGPRRVAARVRHRHVESPALVTPTADGECAVSFDDPQRAIAPGQGVAFYDRDLLLGGGWISSAGPGA